MSRIPEQFIDDLLARLDIVEVIEQRIALKKAGREYHARCPFHDERSPSFTVSRQKQFYHCFGCGAHGSAIKFVMEYDRLDFLDAVEELAKSAGMVMPRSDYQPNDELGELYGILEQASAFFEKQLSRHATAQAYVEKRQIDANTARQFRIGYAPPGWENLKQALAPNDKALALLDKAGLLSSADQGKRYDKFRDRLMFPIRDKRGRVIAFGGRVLKAEDNPKYLNSPETALFHKGRELYGLYEARQANPKLERLLVVEGYMDVVSMAQRGFTAVVATLGTAISKDHTELLFRNSSDVYFCFDGDQAGRTAAWRAVEAALPRMKEGRQAFLLMLPDGEDPDSIIQHEGLEKFEARLAQAMPMSEYFFEALSKELRLDTLEGKAKLAERCKPQLATIPEGAFRDLMFARLAELSQVERKPDASPATRLQRAGTIARKDPPKPSLVRMAISLLVQQPALIANLEPPYLFATLRQPGIPLLMELIALCKARPDIATPGILQSFEGREEGAILHKLILKDLLVSDNWKQEFLGAVERLNRQTMQQRIDDLRAKEKEQPLSDAESRELWACLVATKA